MAIEAQPAVTLMPVANLTPAPWNPRRILDKRFQNLCQSIQADPSFMWSRPVLARANGEIYGGNQRYRAAVHLGWSEIPAIITDIPEQLAQERSVKDNMGWGEWVEDDLAGLLYQLRDQGSKIEDLGFENREIARLLDLVGGNGDTPHKEPAQNKDEIIAGYQKHWATADGQIWEIPSLTTPGAVHRIGCGSSLDPDFVKKLFAGKKAKLMVTDPPYFVAYEGNKHGHSWADQSADASKTTSKTWDALETEEDELEQYSRFLSIALDYLDAKSPIYQWFASTHMKIVAQAWENNQLLFHQLIIWEKPGGMLTHAHYLWRHEPCIYGWKQGSSPDPDKRPPAEATTVWEIPNREEKIIHPTQKPIELFARPIRYHLLTREIVYDPYLGSGTCVLAAEENQRIAYGCEIDPGYVAFCLERLSLRGMQPHLVKTETD